MLQRIQSIYWTLTILCLGFLLMGFELVTFHKDGLNFKLSLFSLKQYDLSGQLIKNSMNYNFILVFITLLVTVYTIFKFKNLKMQLTLAKWTIFLNLMIVFIHVLFSYSGMIVSNPSSIKLNFSVAFLLISCVFSVLAYLGVKKDKSLLDSVDRIR